MKHIEAGVLPPTIFVRWTSAYSKSALEKLPPDERRKITRRWRKLWRKAHRAYAHTLDKGRKPWSRSPFEGRMRHGHLTPDSQHYLRREKMVAKYFYDELLAEYPELFSDD